MYIYIYIERERERERERYILNNSVAPLMTVKFAIRLLLHVTRCSRPSSREILCVNRSGLGTTARVGGTVKMI